VAIKVNSVKEEYDYLDQNPHKCGGQKTGAWSVLGKKPLSMTGMDALLLKCNACGAESVIEFDPISTFPKELQELFKRARKQ
jgi:hypothetical protein